MEAKNYRIGDIVKVRTTDDEFNVIKEIGFSDNQRGYYLRLENINHGVWLEHNGENLILGIPITEKWLIDLGLDKTQYEKHKVRVVLVGDDFVKDQMTFLFNDQFVCKIKYVHELQNLYFVLTGKELELKTKT